MLIYQQHYEVGFIKRLAADPDTRQSAYRRRAFTFGLITICSNRPAVSGSAGYKVIAYSNH
jgi:hypothetical protein